MVAAPPPGQALVERASVASMARRARSDAPLSASSGAISTADHTRKHSGPGRHALECPPRGSDGLLRPIAACGCQLRFGLRTVHAAPPRATTRPGTGQLSSALDSCPSCASSNAR